MRDTGGADPQSAFLRAVVVGAARTSTLTVDLAGTLQDAGHDVTLLTGALTVGGAPNGAARPTSAQPPWAAAPAPRPVPRLAWSRLDTWARIGRRLRGVDVIVLVHSGVGCIPALLALLHGAGATGPIPDRGRRPRIVLVAGAPLARPGQSGWPVGAHLTGVLVRRVDAVLVHDDETAAVATGLGADRVRVTARPESRPGPSVGDALWASAPPQAAATPAPWAPHGGRTRVAIGVVAREVRHGLAFGSRFGSGGLVTSSTRLAERGSVDDHGEPHLRGDWAHYVGVLESLASPLTGGDHDNRDGHDGQGAEAVDPTGPGCCATRRSAVVEGSRELVRTLRTPRAPVPLQRGDLPDWVLPTDVLVDASDGDEAKTVARELGLPRVRDGAQAWAALGALAAIVRIVDDGRRSAVVVDESGARSPLTRWARAVGFAPVSLGLGGPHADLAAVDLEMETLDVIARVHPGGCDVDDIDEFIGSSSWLLRPGGILIVTIPLGPVGALEAIAPADARGVVARAHGFGFALVGDLDGELTALMGAAASSAASADTAYGLVRLTFRRL